jgi:dUTP pyrophosphatase
LCVLTHTNAKPPVKKTLLSAGYDIFSCEEGTIPPKDRQIFNTGVIIIPRNDCYIRIAPRSGLALYHGIDVLAGVVDSDYRGEIKVILYNTSNKEYHVNIGDKIAQLICEQIFFPTVKVVGQQFIDTTERNSTGFGSSGYQ